MPVTLERVEVEANEVWEMPMGGWSDVWGVAAEGLLRIDFAAGSIGATIAVPDHARLVGGDAGPPVLEPAEGAWQVVGDTLEERAFPGSLVDGSLSGGVFGEEAWVVSQPEAERALRRVDLRSGHLPDPQGSAVLAPSTCRYISARSLGTGHPLEPAGTTT